MVALAPLALLLDHGRLLQYALGLGCGFEGVETKERLCENGSGSASTSTRDVRAWWHAVRSLAPRCVPFFRNAHVQWKYFFLLP